MPEKETAPAQAEDKQQPEPSEDDAMQAAGFRKVHGIWRR